MTPSNSSELPDITIYVERLAAYTVGRPLRALRLASPFLLRSVDPPVRELVDRTITGVSRLGKRLVLAFEGDRDGALEQVGPPARVYARPASESADWAGADVPAIGTAQVAWLSRCNAMTSRPGFHRPGRRAVCGLFN